MIRSNDLGAYVFSEGRPLFSEHMKLCMWAGALEMASLKQPMHTVVVLSEMAVNVCCKPVPKLAMSSSPTAPQTLLSDMLWFYELYVQTG